MKFLFLYEEKKECPWIGDKCSLEVLAKGLNELGHQAEISGNTDLIDTADKVILSNISTDLTLYLQILYLKHKPYICIPFHEDFLLYSSIFRSFHAYIANALLTDTPEEALSMLTHMPDIIQYQNFEPKKNSLINYPVMARAEINIANSFEEEKIINRYCPSAKTSTIFLTSGYADKEVHPYSDAFIKRFNLEKQNYIIQIGRAEPRKNQLATILATKDLDRPLVLHATSHFKLSDDYLDTCIQLIKQFRKARTILLTNARPAEKDGQLEIINVPGGLTKDELVSAYQNAACLCHPAFFELPGYVYLEAAKLGTPTVATKWCTVKDYFTDHKTNKYTLDSRVEYPLPYNIPAIKAAVEKQIEKRYEPSKHPIFSRTHLDVAKEFLAIQAR